MDTIKKLISKYYEVLSYLFFGGCTTVVNFVVFFICKNAGMSEVVANIPSWIFAVIFAYVTNKLFVFRSKTTDLSSLSKEITSFFGARIFSLGLEEVVTLVGVNLLGINGYIVKFVGQVIVVVTNYFFSKLFIFKKK